MLLENQMSQEMGMMQKDCGGGGLAGDDYENVSINHKSSLTWWLLAPHAFLNE